MDKIVHVCLCGPVTDGWSYQDNLLSKYHKELGYEVSIITSEWIWGEDGNLKRTAGISITMNMISLSFACTSKATEI